MAVSTILLGMANLTVAMMAVDKRAIVVSTMAKKEIVKEKKEETYSLTCKCKCIVVWC